MAQAVSLTEVDHPLAALTAGEVAAAVALVQADPTYTESTSFAYIGLLEPTREQVGRGHRASPSTGASGSCSWQAPRPTSSRRWRRCAPARSQ